MDTQSTNFGGNPGEMNFYAMGGGATHSDGVSNQAVAQVTVSGYDGNQYVNAGNQRVQTLVTRSFSADPGAEVTVDADITGMIDWINQNWHWNDGTPGSLPSGALDLYSPYSAYKIDASITFLVGSLSGPTVADIPDPIYLDQDHLSDSISFTADSDPDTYYTLFASLAIDTRLQNFSFTYGGPQGPLPDVGSIGMQGDPLLMTTTVAQSPVPIPGSLVLLCSGLLGLLAVRIRR